MLRIESVDCNDCLQVINHILSEYLGLTHYQINKDKNLILSQEDTELEKITEAVDQLKASGIDASLISSDNLIHEGDRLPIKRINRFSVSGESSDEFVRSVERLTAVLEPSNWCQRGHNVPGWCISVAPLSSMSPCISVLAQIKPLPKVLGHVKRAFVGHLDQARVGKVLLGLAGKSFTEVDAVKLVSKLFEMTDISRGVLGTCRVPLCPPRSCRQQKTLSSLIKDDDESRSWPFNFHPNQTLESLLSVEGWGNGRGECTKPYFSFEEIKWHNHWLRRAVDLAKSRSGVVKNASCDLEHPDCVCTCIVTHPHLAKRSDPNEAQPLAEAVSTDGESHIDHAIMLAASQVGRLNRELHYLTDEDGNVEVGRSGRYLLTDCDVYLSTEPCLMCAMALLHSRVKRVFIARRLPSIGGMCSRWKLPLVKGVNHHFLAFAPREI
ncbi:cytidine and deoxycytidylate deaminase [Echinococcus multilocularis]|uniref:Cytidine and deoxycytidylate deaminase n=1 Tax=Echinococcus multilocularis TaxID=6211 RepID=A0A068Y6M6_ECHMU|nr:cytidine and deoxycytidylate deaminase [Echinococcus multilocularis]